MFKIFDFAHFFVDLQWIRLKFEKYYLDNVRHLLGLLPFENDVYGISTEKALYQTVEKHPFRHIQPDCWPLRQKSKKLVPWHCNLDNFPDVLKIFWSRILVSLKKAKGRVFNRG
jgi:hypothetical protein